MRPQPARRESSRPMPKPWSSSARARIYRRPPSSNVLGRASPQPPSNRSLIDGGHPSLKSRPRPCRSGRSPVTPSRDPGAAKRGPHRPTSAPPSSPTIAVAAAVVCSPGDDAGPDDPLDEPQIERGARSSPVVPPAAPYAPCCPRPPRRATRVDGPASTAGRRRGPPEPQGDCRRRPDQFLVRPPPAMPTASRAVGQEAAVLAHRAEPERGDAAPRCGEGRQASRHPDHLLRRRPAGLRGGPNKGRRVTSHRRRYDGQPSTVAEHMPSAHRAHAEWTPSRLIRWAEKVGPATGQLVARILQSRPHPEQGYRAVLGIMRLGRQHGNPRTRQSRRRREAP